ncbi:MAG TPA: type III pantothenate kinase [Firmicutes bacterium]|nr:type III pantothenate kinase [Bacillota bacterium]
MILVMDVGNLEMLLGVFQDKTLMASWKMATDVARTSDEWGSTMIRFLRFDGIETAQITDVVIASVVPPVMYSLIRGVEKYLGLKPLVVDTHIRTNIKVDMQNPAELASDRLVKMMAAYEEYGGPVMVIDYATATTYDVVDREGKFVTGITAPGITVCAESLSSKTAQLPEIAIQRPESIYCRNMVSCIQAGIYYGHVGEAKYLINRVKKELDLPDMKVVATGGLAHVIGEGNHLFDVVDPYLTFRGLRLCYEKNKAAYQGGKGK